MGLYIEVVIRDIYAYVFLMDQRLGIMPNLIAQFDLEDVRENERNYLPLNDMRFMRYLTEVGRAYEDNPKYVTKLATKRMAGLHRLDGCPSIREVDAVIQPFHNEAHLFDYVHAGSISSKGCFVIDERLYLVPSADARWVE